MSKEANEAMARATEKGVMAMIEKYELPKAEAYQVFTEAYIQSLKNEHEAIDINK